MAKKVDLFKEMSVLGRQVHDAFEAAAKSREVHDIQQELSKSFKTISTKIGQAVKTAKESEKSQAIGKQLKKVVKVGKDQGMEKGKELTQKVATGLRELSGHLAQAAAKLKKK